MTNAKTGKTPKTPGSPLYKKWWFWVILLVIVAICGGALSNTGQWPNSSSSTSQTPNDTQDDHQDDKNSNTPATPSIGVAAKADKLEIVVLSVDRNYSASYAKPGDDMEYIKVNLSVKNNSDDLQSYNALHFKIEDSNGSIEPHTNAAMAQADDALNHGDLAAHGTKTGSIVFEVPAGDTNLKLHIYENGFGSKILSTIDLSH